MAVSASEGLVEGLNDRKAAAKYRMPKRDTLLKERPRFRQLKKMAAAFA